jgi:hypothetical protein
MFAQKEAIVRLLQDDDPETVNLVKQKLAERGPAAIPDLQELAAIDDERVSAHAAQVLGEIDSRVATEEFSSICADFPNEGDIESASWVLARVLLPGVRIDPARRQLDDWALELRRRLAPGASARRNVQTMATFLGSELGFRGDADNYYRVENSVLPRVIETRTGIPISLTLLYQLVADRAGVTVDGVNFPGHFLARHEDVLFDPFEGGTIVDLDYCETMLQRQELSLQPAHLHRANPRAMLRRILANLLYIFQNEEDQAANAARCAGWIRALEPR